MASPPRANERERSDAVLSADLRRRHAARRSNAVSEAEKLRDAILTLGGVDE